jgi:hypothetical protein
MSHSGDISLLRLYMENLPQELPFAELGDEINRLSDFCLDADWVESIGEEMTVNREIEAAIFEFGPRNDEGVFEKNMPKILKEHRSRHTTLPMTV